MIDDILVIDDLVGVQYQELIKSRLFKAPWYYLDDVTHPNAPDHVFKDMPRQPGFVHWYKTQSNQYTELFDVVVPVALAGADKINFKISNIVEARSFLQLPSNTKKFCNNIHTDYERPHLVCLYYVCDADGDTIIFDQTEDDVHPSQVSIDKLTIKKTVSPKQGRAVLFNGKHYHASSDPSQGSRMIINFVLEGN